MGEFADESTPRRPEPALLRAAARSAGEAAERLGRLHGLRFGRHLFPALEEARRFARRTPAPSIHAARRLARYAAGLEAARREVGFGGRPVEVSTLLRLDAALLAESGALSNAVAVSGRRSADGRAWLLAEPHLPREDIRLALHPILVEAGGRRLLGLGRPGSPFLVVGAHARCAWALASNWPALGRRRPRAALADFLLSFERACSARGAVRSAIERLPMRGQIVLAADAAGAIAGAWCALPVRGASCGEANRIDDGGDDGFLAACNAVPALFRPGARAGRRAVPWFSDPRALSSHRQVLALSLLSRRRRIGRRTLFALLRSIDDPFFRELRRRRLDAVVRRWRGWDGRATTGSRRAALFLLFVDAWSSVEPRVEAWSRFPQTMPDRFDDRANRRAERALALAERRFERAGRPTLGALQRIGRARGKRWEPGALPVAGTAWTFAAPAAWPPRRPGSPLSSLTPPRVEVRHGASFALVVALGPGGVEAWCRLPPEQGGGIARLG